MQGILQQDVRRYSLREMSVMAGGLYAHQLTLHVSAIGAAYSGKLTQALSNNPYVIRAKTKEVAKQENKEAFDEIGMALRAVAANMGGKRRKK